MENKTIQERVKQYLELYEEVREKMGDERVAMAVMQEVAKDTRVEQMKAERLFNRNNGNENAPASVRQIALLLSMGLLAKLPNQLSKQEASRLIEEAKAVR